MISQRPTSSAGAAAVSASWRDATFIVPDSLGGEDTPSNFVILCKRCHLDNPNVADPEVMWDWLRAYSVPPL